MSIFDDIAVASDGTGYGPWLEPIQLGGKRQDLVPIFGKDRKKVEMLFGHLKPILKLDRLRLRGITGANDEFLLAATAQNLRRMALWLTTGPPDHTVSAHA